MKKILFMFACSTCAIYAHGQNQTFYMMMDQVSTYSTKNTQLNKPEYTYWNPYIGKTFGKGHFGLFVESVIEPDVYSINPGIMLAFQKRKTYHEFGFGPGFEMPKIAGASEKVTYANFYYYGENQIDSTNSFKKKGKVIWNMSLSYAPKDWGVWWLSYITYYPTKSLGIGLYSQKDALSGIQVRYILPVSKTVKPSIWIAGGVNESSEQRIAAGFTLMGQWEKRKRS